MRSTRLALLLLLVLLPATAHAQRPVDPAAPGTLGAPGGSGDDPLLAPQGRCRGDADPAAHHRVQRLAMHCLLQQVRRRADLGRLRPNAVLRHSAIFKARRIAACRVFTHSPCGDVLAVPFREAQLTRAGRWTVGENLAWGVGEDAAARDVVARWLASPSHRRVLVDGRFSHLGVRRRRLRMRGAPVGAVLWVAHLGRPRRG